MTTAILRNTFQKLINRKADEGLNTQVFGQKMGLATKLFGCWHEQVSRPFTAGKTAYRSCLSCGARRQFDPETLRTFGGFYTPPVIEES